MLTEEYQKLGWKTFWVFWAEHSTPAAILFLILCVFVLFNLPYLLYIFLVFLVVFGITLFMSWIEYSSFGYVLGENALKIKRGVIHKDEIAIPYKQIQNVDIERTVANQLSGTSKLVILTAGHEDNTTGPMKSDSGAESEGIIPIIDKNLARALQEQLLTKANIQKVVQA